MAEGNVELGRFDLVGIPPAPRGVPQIEVTFDIDANGIVHVNAKDLGTGKEQSIKISAPKKLSKEEIDKFVKEAEKFAQEDEKKREEVDVLNQADTLVYATEKSLKEFGEKVGQSERADIESRINDLKQAMKDKNIDGIKRGMEELTKVSHKLAEEIYKRSSAQGPKSGPDTPQRPKEEPEGEKKSSKDKKGEDIIDADFTAEDEGNDKKKKIKITTKTNHY